MRRYNLEEKPNYTQGQEVVVDLGCMVQGAPKVRGRIVGKVVDNIIDHWIIQFPRLLTELAPHQNFTYPFTCLSVQHTFIVAEGMGVVEPNQRTVLVENGLLVAEQG